MCEEYTKIINVMEKSMNETETHQSFRSPPRRRRSTFFERRDSILPPRPEIEDTNECKLSSETNSNQDQNLRSYYESLLAEKEQWKKEVNDRRNKYHDLRQQYQIAVKASSRSRISYSALSNEDIEFLKAKPNISKLVESRNKLHKSVLHAQALFRRANELENVILSHCESRVDEITEYILENSTIEPME